MHRARGRGSISGGTPSQSRGNACVWASLVRAGSMWVGQGPQPCNTHTASSHAFLRTLDKAKLIMCIMERRNLLISFNSAVFDALWRPVNTRCSAFNHW